MTLDITPGARRHPAAPAVSPELAEDATPAKPAELAPERPPRATDGSRYRLELSTPDPQASEGQVKARIHDDGRPVSPEVKLGVLDGARRQQLLDAWDRLSEEEQTKLIASCTQSKGPPPADDFFIGDQLSPAEHIGLGASFEALRIGGMQSITEIVKGAGKASDYVVAYVGLGVAVIDAALLIKAVHDKAGRGAIIRKALRVALDAAIFMTPFAIPASVGLALVELTNNVRKSRAEHDSFAEGVTHFAFRNALADLR